MIKQLLLMCGLLGLFASSAAEARFVSVDPVRANANNGQNFNRYYYANNNPYKFTDPDGRQSAADRWSDTYAKSAKEGTTEQFKPFEMPAVVVTAVMAAPVIAEVGMAALANPITANSFATGLMDAGMGNALGGTSLVGGASAAASKALSEMRYTQKGEAFIRYESADSAFSHVTPSGVTRMTYAAPASDGLIPLEQRIGTYNLPSPEIARSNVFTLRPPSGTLIIGPRPVQGGTGNEVLFPIGY